jgi:hypothetical protein
MSEETAVVTTEPAPVTRDLRLVATNPNQLAVEQMSDKYEPYAATAREYVEQWDKGEPVWTIELGGLGPGYEQAIQVLVVELCRDNLDKLPLPANGDKDAWQKWGEETITRTDKAAGGYSGAQVGAAKSLAFRYLSDGPRALFAKFKAEQGKEADRRMIQVSSFWPKSA